MRTWPILLACLLGGDDLLRGRARRRLQQVAAIDKHLVAGDKAGRVRDQKVDGLGNLVALADPVQQGGVAHQRLDHLGAQADPVKNGGVHGARADDVHPDVRGQVDGQTLGEHGHGRLGHTVGVASLAGLDRGHTGHKDQVAFGALELVDGRQGGPNGGVRIDGHHLPVELVAVGVVAARLDKDARVVDENIQTTKVLNGPFHGHLAIVWLAKVQHQAERLSVVFVRRN